jgi:chromosome partitioning protein
MRVIGFWNRKGGTGKTTTAGNVAGELRHYGKTLLVDTDPQANVTSWLVTRECDKELADVLAGKARLWDCVVNVRDNLDVLPSFAIGGDLGDFAETKLPKQPFAFMDLRDECARLGYAFVLLDLAPGDSTLERSALAMCDEVVLVAAPEYFSADGLEAARDTLESVKRERRCQFASYRLVANRAHGSYAAHKVFLDEYRSNGAKVYTINQSTPVHDAVMQHATIWEADPGNRTTGEYQRLAQDLAGKGE